MKIVIPDPKSLHALHPVNRLPGIRNSLEIVHPRDVTHPGNISMHDHLAALEVQMDAELEVDVIWP